MNNDQIVKIENLSHRYSVKWAVKDINITIDKRGIYGLLGSNGAGKSTIMNIMCGVIKQTDGNVYICGIDTIGNPVASRVKIGFLPQKPPLQNELTVLEYLKHCAVLRLIPKSEVNAALVDVMKICNLEHMKDRLISNLSGGYQQRVGIAQAIIHKPEVVIFDEPTNGLDPNQILEIRGLIRDIAKDRTVILSTHILSEVQAVCDKIIMIENGSVIFNGTVSEFDSYISPDTVYVSLLDMPTIESIESIDGVISAVSLGTTEYRIKCDDTATAIQNIVTASVANGWRLDAINVEKSSMDDIFALLSKDQKLLDE